MDFLFFPFYHLIMNDN